MPDDLRHYAPTPVVIEARTPKNGTGLKPSGLWVSVGTAWLDWCRSEEFRTGLRWYEHEVTVAPGANILNLSSGFDLDDFTTEFGVKLSLSWESPYIDWGRVAERYDGITIAPYQWSRRNEPRTFWYYGWDCASGCIWNPSVVSLSDAVELLEVATGGES